MDFPRGLERRQAAFYGPGAGLHRSCGEKAHEVEHPIGILNEAVPGRLLNAEVGQKEAAFVFFQFGDFHFHLAADRHRGESLFLNIGCDFLRHCSLHLFFCPVIDNQQGLLTQKGKTRQQHLLFW